MRHLIGAGHVAERIIKNGMFGSEYCVYDNNQNMQGARLAGVEIERVAEVLQRDGPIIICTTSILEVQQQLDSLGVKNEIIIAPEVAEFQSHAELDEFSGAFLIASGLPSNNMRGASGGLYKVQVALGGISIEKICDGSCHGVLRTANGFAVTHQERGVVLLDERLTEVGVIELPLNSRCHGIAMAGESFFVACSNRDSIIEVCQDGRMRHEISLSRMFTQTGTAHHHINDLDIVGRHAYVSMFSLSGAWKSGIFDGGVMRVDLDTSELTPVVRDLTLPHSVRNVDRSFTVLNSFDGTFKSFGKFPEYRFNGFLRGFDADERYFYFGESRNRNSTGLQPRNRPISIDTNIQIVDKKHHYSRALQLPVNISEIHSILKIEND